MVATQLTVLDEISKVDEMVGRAIFTIVPSREDINAAREMEIVRRVIPVSPFP
jgi:GTPase